MKRKYAQDILSNDMEAGRAFLRRQASDVHGYDGLFIDKDPTEELTTYYERLFNVKKEDRAEAKAAVDFWPNSWTAGKTRARQAKFQQKFHKNQKIEKGKTARRGSQHKFFCRRIEGLAEKLNERCKNLQFDEGRSHESSSGRPTQRNGNTTS